MFESYEIDYLDGDDDAETSPEGPSGEPEEMSEEPDE